MENKKKTLDLNEIALLTAQAAANDAKIPHSIIQNRSSGVRFVASKGKFSTQSSKRGSKTTAPINKRGQDR